MEGDLLARGVYQAMRRLWRNSRMTDHSTTESVMNLQAIQRVELSTGLVTFLEFTLEMAEDVVESKTALAGRAHASAHAAHTDEPLRLHCRATLAANGRPLTIEVKRITGTGSRRHVLVMA